MTSYCSDASDDVSDKIPKSRWQPIGAVAATILGVAIAVLGLSIDAGPGADSIAKGVIAIVVVASTLLGVAWSALARHQSTAAFGALASFAFAAAIVHVVLSRDASGLLFAAMVGFCLLHAFVASLGHGRIVGVGGVLVYVALFATLAGGAVREQSIPAAVAWLPLTLTAFAAAFGVTSRRY